MSGLTGYIVLLNPGVDKQHHLDWLGRAVQHPNHFNVTNDYSVIHAYSADLHDEALNALRGSPDVIAVEEDVDFEYDAVTVQQDSGWALNRISQIEELTNQNSASSEFHYTYEDPGMVDVNIYIIEGGCRITHEDFEGRASYGYTDPNLNSTDSQKHGTEVASCAGGKRCGVAKHSKLIICRTHNPKPSNAIAALDWINQEFARDHVAAVVNMSFGRLDREGNYTALDQAVANTVRAGIHCCASAGNDDIDARYKTPARAEGCNAVGATTIEDARSSFSNYGPVVKLFAPGSHVRTADVSSDTKYSYHNGTSFSSPYVAGLIAYIISLRGNVLMPEAMTAYLQETAIRDVLSNIPPDTVNLLAYNGILGPASK
ncbi:hypothetical protein PHLGIDRAFT_35649 [Phlebiopsis gigantea 11061_1 CR5-6]|uniref:Peptidase S8/S53 domain-containing protein n=1 Tax=Phlebiopsis gigantea (strain 11061_1 CR5-6) TaxID=745531 RepID=A0A0C3SAG9_PHLG1|nr:hypothetical protein PHLGIDRAFT_35649 [Phlebiopsis gigantea 11061_1 CR5-6]